MLTLITLAVDVYTDSKKWGKINHLRGVLLRLPVFVLDVIIWLPNVFIIASYWLLFDTIINKVRKLPLDYIGETAWIDKMQRRYPVLWLVKVVVGIGGIALYINSLADKVG